MRYLTFSPEEHSSYEICFLVPQLHAADMRRLYLDEHLPGMDDKILAYDLHKGPKTTPVKEQREYLDDLLPILQDLDTKYLITCDAEYFKTLTKSKKADSELGYVKDSVAGDFKVIYCPNFRQAFYNPEKVKADIRTALSALQAHRAENYIAPGMDVIKFAAYPKTTSEIQTWLQRLLDMDCDLAIDIEAFSLKHHDAGIGTISFAWSKHEGIAFPVDYEAIPGATEAPFGRQGFNKPVRALLKEFFQKYIRKQIWHNISYDVYVLIYQLFMHDLLDTEGLLDGLEVMLRNWDDTKLITYLATNSCAGNKLGLKDQAQEYAGNYAQDDIKDIRKIPLDELLQYNLVDSCATWYVHEKHWDTLVADQQEEIYTELFRPAIVDIIQMQLTGLPIDMDAVKELQVELQAQSDDALSRMTNNQLVQSFIYEWKMGWIAKENLKLKTKERTMEEADAAVQFNPNSDPQLQTLLFDEKHMALPVLDRTKTKMPSSGKDTLEKLVNHTDDPEILNFLQALLDFKAVDKILTSFIPAFLRAALAPDGSYYLFGNFNLGGTVSGRLSSSNPNLQNLPANGKLAKLVKKCFKAPPGYLFVGLDFASLEDRISALTTKDPNKLKVYTDGYDGHCLRAQSYFKDQMPDIDPNSVESINSIAKKYKDLRGKSKAPTFALTYQGTYITLMNNCGFSKELAQAIEASYHELYQVSDQWVSDRLDEASQRGYITGAFGLRVRTPLLHQVIRGTSRTPYEAEAEGRTAGNALGQSWCLLNSRASVEFMRLVRAGKYRLSIRPCAHIHDAQYFLIPDEMEIIRYMNKHLVKAVQWQDHPDIRHDQVHLGGELSIFFPDWSCELEIPNDASEEEIKSLALEHHNKYCV